MLFFLVNFRPTRYETVPDLTVAESSVSYHDIAQENNSILNIQSPQRAYPTLQLFEKSTRRMRSTVPESEPSLIRLKR